MCNTRCKCWKKLPTSTGECTGFLNHPKFLVPSELWHMKSARFPLIASTFPTSRVIESIVFPPPMPQAPNLSKGDHDFRFQVELLVVIVGSNNLSTIKYRYLKWRNPEPYKAIFWGWVLVSTSILGTWNVWWIYFPPNMSPNSKFPWKTKSLWPPHRWQRIITHCQKYGVLLHSRWFWEWV